MRPYLLPFFSFFFTHFFAFLCALPLGSKQLSFWSLSNTLLRNKTQIELYLNMQFVPHSKHSRFRL
jgi:hypothetical protein